MRRVAQRRLRTLVAIASLHAVMVGTPAMAVEPTPAAAPSAEELKQGQYTLKILMSALQAPNVPVPVKNALFACIYTNPVSKISKAMNQTAVANKVDIKNPDKALAILAGVCGYRPKPAPTR